MTSNGTRMGVEIVDIIVLWVNQDDIVGRHWNMVMSRPAQVQDRAGSEEDDSEEILQEWIDTG